jgi:hypothetical protein
LLAIGLTCLLLGTLATTEVRADSDFKVPLIGSLAHTKTRSFRAAYSGRSRRPKILDRRWPRRSHTSLADESDPSMQDVFGTDSRHRANLKNSAEQASDELLVLTPPQ